MAYDIPDLDTSLAATGKTLTTGVNNYVYVEDGDYAIKLENDPLLYPVAKIFVGMSGEIETIVRYNTLTIGTKGDQGIQGIQGPQGIQGVQGPAGAQ